MRCASHNQICFLLHHPYKNQDISSKGRAIARMFSFEKKRSDVWIPRNPDAGVISVAYKKHPMIFFGVFHLQQRIYHLVEFVLAAYHEF